MNWSDIAPVVGAVAPVAGKIIGGLVLPVGGAFIGEKFGGLIADALGVPRNPEAVKTAIEKDRDLGLAAINAATERARAEIAGFTEVEKAAQASIQESIREVNATMRVELLPENRHWFFTGGRAAAMWVLVSYLAALAALAVWASVLSMVGGRSEPLKVLTDAWPLHGVIVGALAALVGVFIRSPEGRVTAVQVPAPAQVLTKKKTP